MLQKLQVGREPILEPAFLKLFCHLVAERWLVLYQELFTTVGKQLLAANTSQSLRYLDEPSLSLL